MNAAPVRGDHADRDTEKRFLNWVYGTKPAQVVWGKYWTGEQVPPDGLDALLERAGDQRLYFHAHDLIDTWADPTTHASGKVTSAGLHHSAGSRHIPFDFDAIKWGEKDAQASDESRAHYGSEATRIADALEAGFRRLGIQPSATWMSGPAGRQGIIRLDQVVSPEKVRELTSGLASVLGSDPSVHNPNRVLRVAGSMNVKTEHGRQPTRAELISLTEIVTPLATLEAALASGDAPVNAAATAATAATDRPEVKIDWTKVRGEYAGWLKSAADLPDDFPTKGRIIVGHSGTLNDLCDDLKSAGLMQKAYASWSDVTQALAAVFKAYGRFSAEQIAAALMCKLECNVHVWKLRDDAKMQRAVERAITRSHKPKAAAVKRPDGTDDGRPVIEWFDHSYPEILDRVEKILVERQVGLFQAEGRLVHTYRYNVETEDEYGVKRKSGALLIHDVSAARFNEYMTSNINFVQDNGEDRPPKKIAAPEKLSSHYLARHDLWRLPVLTGIVEAPTLRADGSVLSVHGYDRQSGLMLDTNGVEFPAIPESPSRDEAVAALGKLKEVLDEFPFVDDASLSVALSAILTTLVRRQLRNAPVHGFDANSPGTGKSLLANVVSYIATGRACAAMTLPTNEEESVKTWVGILRKGDPVINIDNVDTVVTGGTLCKIVTEQFYENRLLGGNEMSMFATNVSIICNGNNLTFGADMAIRAVKARMDAGMEHPDEREFKRDLDQYLPEHRAELIVAALTVLRGYIVAGRPFAVKKSRFNDWDRLVRGALIWCGEVDPQDTRADVDELDPVRADLASIVDALRKCFGVEKSVTSQQIVNRANESDDDGQALCAELQPHMANRPIQSRGVTALLSKHKDTIVNGHRIRRSFDKKSKVAYFHIEAVATGPAQGGLDL